MTDGKEVPPDYDEMIADLVHQVDSKMEDIKATIRSIAGIIQERQALEVKRKDAEDGDHA